MKLISIPFTKQMLAVSLLAQSAVCMGARAGSPARASRVFWNKFDVVANNDNTILLTWNVTEYNNKSFIVQHSLNGADWEDIATVQSKNSAESITDYSYKYRNQLGGKQYYRLKDVDVDTKSTGFSPVKTIVLENEKEPIVIWPNPVTSILHITHDADHPYTKACIFDLAGKMMIENKLGVKNNEINVTGLPAGAYILKIENNQGAFLVQKIVKQ